MSTEGRWTGKWFEWCCPSCGNVRASLNAPSFEEARCLRCRTTDAATSIQDLVARLDNERAEWMGRARAAEREVEELRAQIAALKGVAA